MTESDRRNFEKKLRHALNYSSGPMPLPLLQPISNKFSKVGVLVDLFASAKLQNLHNSLHGLRYSLNLLFPRLRDYDTSFNLTEVEILKGTRALTGFYEITYMNVFSLQQFHIPGANYGIMDDFGDLIPTRPMVDNPWVDAVMWMPSAGDTVG